MNKQCERQESNLTILVSYSFALPNRQGGWPAQSQPRVKLTFAVVKSTEGVARANPQQTETVGAAMVAHAEAEKLGMGGRVTLQSERAAPL